MNVGNQEPQHQVICDCLPTPTLDRTHTLSLCGEWTQPVIFMSPKLFAPFSLQHLCTHVPRNTPKLDRYLLGL